MLIDYSNALQTQASFTINSLNLIINSSQDVSFSPYSLISALAMCYIGAGGQTEREFKKLLSPNMDKTEYFNLLENSVNSIGLTSTNETNIYVANRIFLQNDYIMDEKFKKDVEKYLKASTQNLNFSDTTNSAKIINDFISNATHDKIKDLISPSDINSLTTAILTNALYFKSHWQDKFNKNLTKNDTFFTTESKNKTVEMMNKKGKFLYGNDEHFHIVKIPYTNNNITFALILPRNRNELRSRLEKLNSTNLLNLIHSTDRRSVNFSMPKFKTESTHKLKESLSKMGLNTAFSSSANFSSMSPTNNLYIDNVIQKVYVDVNEEGTEAAAATGAIMVMKSLPIEFMEEITVRADHPFLYLILHKEDILFCGIYQ
uniref:SERPIN domain-containing protein n=1 Tax=Strongyloides papillosus TaxID=174720 RepID=A0A0N5BJ72_STREA